MADIPKKDYKKKRNSGRTSGFLHDFSVSEWKLTLMGSAGKII